MTGIFLFLGGLGGWEIILILLAILFPVLLWIWPLIDCLKSDFKNNDKLVWVFLILFLPLLGLILYLTIGRNQKVKTEKLD